MSDWRLARRILAGDRAAGERWVREQYPRIFRMLRRLTGAAEAAEDLTQQAFLKAWQNLAAYRGEASLATWLSRIAYHEYTHWLRGRREHTPLDEAADLRDRRAEPSLEALLLREALAQLSPEHRVAFLLYHIQGLSVGEAALVLEVPPGTVKSRLFHARQRLRELLSEPPQCEEMLPVEPRKHEGHEVDRKGAAGTSRGRVFRCRSGSGGGGS
jgi:RNA polymerase sigma-70 factor (ECF subfamily)